MNTIADAFEAARAEGRIALIPYLVGGWPDPASCVSIAVALARAGADIIEIGIPYSDPVADGPTIQRASTQALTSGATTASVIAVIRDIRARIETPIVAMGYANPILRYGIDRFMGDASAAGVDGLIIADVPIEESNPFADAAKIHGIDLILLVAPTTTDERLARIARATRGFTYVVSRTGVTGARDHMSVGLADLVARVRRHATTPVAVGFGVSTRDHVSAVAAAGADGVIIGSALIDCIERVTAAESVASATTFLASLKPSAPGCTP